MKLQGIILPTSLAVSTPTIVPAGALWVTVKLLIVIVMNLSGGRNMSAKRMSLFQEHNPPFALFIAANLGTKFVIDNIGNVNIAVLCI
jgi:hypothetical protein